ncbi:hypothetical protein OGAPHI_000815 [Ogataea philodendri]|uniref:AMMECR1 domain-containing protein n=1 Tax=Ogataea philodendri TaxID=1378263 RepID=A0A9P8TA05_9ASCO|nr:uncharacterized protein OGAPHI_000815 [Ogataea philodendri]KAH3671104.1 hypothetical protein OGAPHI_000815 [Ogataea philodendri]
MSSVLTYTAYAFETLYSTLNKIDPIPFSEWKYAIEKEHTVTKESCPLFVTWNVLDGTDKVLRGCIGNFGDLTLPEGVKDYALVAAFEDSRFDPISAAELPDLACSVTLLKNFEKAKDALDWELGKHGIRILINGQRSATFLPEVAVEQGWNKDQTLDHLVRKAGYYVTNWKQVQIELTRYQGLKESIDYETFTKLRGTLAKGA